MLYKQCYEVLLLLLLLLELLNPRFLFVFEVG